MMETEKRETPPQTDDKQDDFVNGEIVNVSGHVQELDRNFGVWSICAMAIMSDNAWAAGGATLVIALYNGGGPGVLYGLIAATFFYAFIVVSLAELASAIPSSANVYHWASVTAGKYGRVCSFYAGWWNALAWAFGGAAVSLSAANALVAMYELHHPDFAPQRWQVFIAYLGISFLQSLVLLYGQRFLAGLSNVFGAACLLIAFITIMVCAIMPSQTGAGYASNAFVWTEWQNLTGYSSNGFVFLLGMLNGAFAIGTPEGVCHLAEEIPNPRRNIPIGMAAQLTTGFLTTFCYYIAILYAITSLEEIQGTSIVSLPLAAVYQQATQSVAGTTGLLFIFFLDILVTCPGAYLVASRMLWTLGRDDAVPFSGWIRQVSPRWRNPFNAQLVILAIVIVLGCIYIGSVTAFGAFTGVFIILTTLSYLISLLPHMITRRKHVKPGPFRLVGVWAYIVPGVACAYIIVFDVIYMFPYAMPVEAATTMNYSCVIAGGITLLLTPWYLYKRTRGYKGPIVVQDASDNIMTGIVGLSKEEEEARRLAALRNLATS